MFERNTNLERRLQKIGAVFDIKKLMRINPDKQYIIDYYSASKWAYRFLYSREDLIHMGLSRSGKFHKEDLIKILYPVEQAIRFLKPSKVLEMATGKGANSYHLARKYPKVSFIAFDVTAAQFTEAKIKSTYVNNYQVFNGDYHDLSLFADESFEVVFILEALCHSKEKDVVLDEVFRVLKKGGQFIVIDAYYRNDISTYTEEQRIMSKLTEVGMAVPEFEVYSKFIKMALKVGFKIKFEEDVSKYILPSLYKIEKLARAFFKFKILAKFIAKLFPPKMVYNAISGYLMALTIEQKVACYMITVLEKK